MYLNKSEINIELYQGIILTIILFSIFQFLYILTDPLSQLIFSLYEKRSYLPYSFGRLLYIDTQSFIIYVLRLVIIYLIVQKYIGISIKEWLFQTHPSLTQCLYWSFIGACLALSSSILAWQESIEDPFHIVGISTVVAIVLNLIVPLQEEIVHRGILFSTLLRKGRLPAYFISTGWFVLGHVPSYSELIFYGNMGLTLPHFVLLILMAILTGYIYETTKKLSLCIIFHSACNLTTVVSAFLNYLVEGI